MQTDPTDLHETKTSKNRISELHSALEVLFIYSFKKMD